MHHVLNNCMYCNAITIVYTTPLVLKKEASKPRVELEVEIG